MSNPISKLKEYWALAKKHSDDHYQYTWYIFFDMMYCRICYGIYLDSYYEYKLYKFNRFVSGNFLVYKSQSKLWKQFNSNDAHNLFVDKFRFNEKFSEFIKRKYILASEKSRHSVRDFIEREKNVIVKPVNDHCGIGIFILNAGDKEKVEQFITSLKDQTYIVEEIVTNAEPLKKLNPNSLNTLRIVTCIDGTGKLHIISATLRIGGSVTCVDNAHSGGMACAVNLEHGIVDSYAYDKNGNSYIIHPVTGEQIIGVSIPDWDKIIPYLHRIAFVEPAARYVGWDIAVTDNGFELIEGNTDHDSDVMQMCHLTGRRRQIQSLL